MTTRTKVSQCMACFKVYDAHSQILDKEDAAPKEGDFSICLYCATICEFDADLNLVPATAEDLQDFREKQPEDYYKLLKAAIYIKEQTNKN